MSITVEPDTEPVTNGQVPDRSEQLRLCKLFNEKYSQGIESKRRANLKKRIDKLIPEIRKILLEAEAVETGERRRFIEAVDRLTEHEGLSGEETMMLDNVDSRTKGIWDCCEFLYSTYDAKCRYCGERSIPSTSLDDLDGLLHELSKLLSDENTREENK